MCDTLTRAISLHLIGGTVLFLSGCGSENRSSQPQPAPAPAVAASETPAVDSIGVAGVPSLPESEDIDDPSRDGWASEAFHQSSNAQLKRLTHLLVTPKAVRGESLVPLVSDNFRGSSLRPRNLRTVFAHDPIGVLRSPNKGPEAGVDLVVEGRDSLAGELIELCTSGASAPTVRVETKTYRVADEPSGHVTQVLVSIFARGPEGSTEQNAHWTCRWTDEQPPRLQEITVDDYEAVQIRSPAGVLFSDCTASVLEQNESFKRQLLHGSDHWLRQIDNTIAVDEYGRYGLTVGDVNGDGLDDVYVCQQAGQPNRLVIQQPEGTARDVSTVAGVDWMESSHSALLLDLDNDGDQDLAMSTNPAVLVMENEQGRFRLAQRIPTAQTVFSLSAIDVDNDGLLDLYGGVYQPDARKEGLYPRPIPYHDANNGGANILWINETIPDGPWRFVDRTKDFGLDADNSRFTLAAAWEDFDNDGDADLYVANDYGRNCLYRNDGGRFHNTATAAGVEDASFGMSVTWGDYNRDGWMDLYVSNMFSGAGNRITYQRRFTQGVEGDDLNELQYLARGNSLFQNAGDGSFVDVSNPAGVMMGRWAWASQFADINNDGWEDLLVANGFLTTDDHRDL